MLSTSEWLTKVEQAFGNYSSVFFYLIWILKHEHEDPPHGASKL